MAVNLSKGSNIATRVSDSLRAKAEYIADKENRKLADWARLALQQAIADYEAKNGEIKLPATT